MTPRCPICKAALVPRAENRAWPFCSPRCRMVDLGRWLGEDYRFRGPVDPGAAHDTARAWTPHHGEAPDDEA